MQSSLKETSKNKSSLTSPRDDSNANTDMICKTHNEKIVSFCLAKKCNFSPLCSKCIVIHLNSSHQEGYEEVNFQNFETLKQNYSNKLQKMIGEYEKLLKEISKYTEKKILLKEFEIFEKNIGLFKEYLIKTLEESYCNFLKEFTTFFNTQNSTITEKIIAVKKTIQTKVENFNKDFGDLSTNKSLLNKLKENSLISMDCELEKNLKTCKKLISESVYLSNYQPIENNSDIFSKFSKEISEVFSSKFPLKTANTGLINNSSVFFEKNTSFLTKKSYLNLNSNGKTNDNSKILIRSFDLNAYDSLIEAIKDKNTLTCLKLPPSPHVMRMNKNGLIHDKSIERLHQTEEIHKKSYENLKKNTFRSLSPPRISGKIERNSMIEFKEKQFVEYLQFFDKKWKSHNIKVLPLDLCKSISLIKNGNLPENQKILRKFTNIYYETINSINKNEANPFFFCFIVKEMTGEYCFCLLSGFIKKNMEIFFINFNNQEKIIEKHQNIILALKAIFSLFLYEKLKNLNFKLEEIKYVIFDKCPSNDLKRLAICYSLSDLSKSKARNGGIINNFDLEQFQKKI